MSEPNPRFWKVFFEVYNPLPRQGTGQPRLWPRKLSVCAATCRPRLP